MPKTVKSLPEDKTGCGSLPFSVARSRAPFCSLLLARGRPRFGLRLRLARTSRSSGLSFSARTSVLALVRFFDLWTLVAASCVFYTVFGKKKIQRAQQKKFTFLLVGAKSLLATRRRTRRAFEPTISVFFLVFFSKSLSFDAARRTHTKAIYIYRCVYIYRPASPFCGWRKSEDDDFF